MVVYSVMQQVKYDFGVSSAAMRAVTPSISSSLHMSSTGPLPDPIAPPLFSALANTYDGTSLTDGTRSFSSEQPNTAPILVSDWMVFTTDYLLTTDPDIINTLASGAWECSVLYRPTSLVNGYIWAVGSSGTNTDNSIQLNCQVSGEIRLQIDGNVGAGQQTIGTTGVAMQVGEEYLITVMVKNGGATIRVNGVENITDRAITGAQPVGMDRMVIGARVGATVSANCDGSVKFFEVVAL